MTGIRSNNNNFINAIFDSDNFKREIHKNLGATINQITTGELKRMNFYIPSLTSEQNYLGNLMKVLDKLITLQQRKLENYLLIKKKLSNIFFNDKIVNKNDLLFEHRVKANQLFISYSKKGLSHLPVLSASQNKGMVFRKDESKNILYTHDNLTNYKLVEPDDFVVHLRSFQGGFAYSDKTGIASPAYTIFKFKNNVAYNSVYWKEKFKSYNFIQLLKKITYGVRDGRSISFSDFLSLYLTFPDIKLQNKIGNVLSKLDTQISDQKEIIKKLENIKQFLLQNMFI
ncbi:type i restriction-modification system, specificity subunit s [Lactobacillus taiwanensis DSM 21401]|nr:type i restriction-modification system, specificity subunit s [Lactobacillus taiwanensis DSM 21401]